MPAKFSEQNAADDKLSIAAYTFKLLTEEQRRAIYTALKGQPAGPAFNADIGVELPSSVELRPMAGRRRRRRAADQGLSLRRGGQWRAVGVVQDRCHAFTPSAMSSIDGVFAPGHVTPGTAVTLDRTAHPHSGNRDHPRTEGNECKLFGAGWHCCPEAGPPPGPLAGENER